MLREFAFRKKREFMQSFLGRDISAITLTHFDGEFTESLTDNYLKLLLHGRHEPNQVLNLRVEEARGEALIAGSPGEMLHNPPLFENGVVVEFVPASHAIL